MIRTICNMCGKDAYTSMTCLDDLRKSPCPYCGTIGDVYPAHDSPSYCEAGEKTMAEERKVSEAKISLQLRELDFVWLTERRTQYMQDYAEDITKGDFIAASESAQWAQTFTILIEHLLDDFLLEREQTTKTLKNQEEAPWFAGTVNHVTEG